MGRLAHDEGWKDPEIENIETLDSTVACLDRLDPVIPRIADDLGS